MLERSRAVQKAAFAPPPPSHQEVINVIQVVPFHNHFYPRCTVVLKTLYKDH